MAISEVPGSSQTRVGFGVRGCYGQVSLRTEGVVAAALVEDRLVDRAVEVPRPDCPGCGRPMTFEGSYPRWVRIFPTTWRIFIRRASCATCGKGHALLPDFVTLHPHVSLPRGPQIPLPVTPGRPARSITDEGDRARALGAPRLPAENASPPCHPRSPSYRVASRCPQRSRFMIGISAVNRQSRRDKPSAPDFYQIQRKPIRLATADCASSREAKPISSPGSARVGIVSAAVAKCQASMARRACWRTSRRACSSTDS